MVITVQCEWGSWVKLELITMMKKHFHLQCPSFARATRAKSAWGRASVMGTVLFPWKSWQRGMRGMVPEQVPCGCHQGSDHTDWMEMSWFHPGWFVCKLYHPNEVDLILLVYPLGLGIPLVCSRYLLVEKLYEQWPWIGVIMDQVAQALVTPCSVGPRGQVTLQWQPAVQVPLSAAFILSSLLLKLIRVRMRGAGFSLSLSLCCGLHCAPPPNPQFICWCSNPQHDYI